MLVIALLCTLSMNVSDRNLNHTNTDTGPILLGDWDEILICALSVPFLFGSAPLTHFSRSVHHD